MKGKLLDKNRVLVSNIQRFSLQDGPGIRTTVFLKGCSLHCPWCSNPETISHQPEPFLKDGQVLECGTYYSNVELYEILMRDRIYYENGGVTFSGGEPLLQVRRYEDLLKKLKEEDIHLCAETALFVSRDNLEIAVRYFDLMYIDIKILDGDRCKKYLGGDISEYIRNLQFVVTCNVPIILRMPLVGGYTDDEVNIKNVIRLMKNSGINTIELLQEHHMGLDKYAAVGRDKPTLKGMSDDEMRRCQSIFEAHNIKTKLLQL